MEFILDKYRPELRRRAVKDTLLYITEVADYVITVLISELAVILIKEDIRIGDKETRRIL